MTQIVGIEVVVCKNSPWQIRTADENPAKAEIKATMKKEGRLLTPIRGYWKNGFFLVWDGGTRLQCAKELGWLHIDAILDEPINALTEMTLVLTANYHSRPHWLGVDNRGEAISGKAFIISLMAEQGSYADAAHRAGVSVQEAVAAYFLRNEAPAEIRFAVADGRLSWTAYCTWLETESSKQSEVVEKLGNGERLTTSSAKKIKKDGKGLSRKRAKESQVSLPFIQGTQHELGMYTNILVDVRKMLRTVTDNRSALVARDLQLLSDIQVMISTCEEEVGYAE